MGTLDRIKIGGILIYRVVNDTYMTVYSFRIAYTSEDELQALQEQKDFDPEALVLTVLPDGQPSYKTLYARAETEEEAVTRVDSYVSRTPYRNIEDRRFI